jgi:sugar/nucleoside kinase (ribokinase family)
MFEPRIVVIGSSNTDLVIRSSRLPRPGQTVLGGDLDILAGGKGANQAVAAARHTVLAGNITNVNTPGYRLRDLSETAFQQKLKEALANSKQSAAPSQPQRYA